MSDSEKEDDVLDEEFLNSVAGECQMTLSNVLLEYYNAMLAKPPGYLPEHVWQAFYNVEYETECRIDIKNGKLIGTGRYLEVERAFVMLHEGLSKASKNPESHDYTKELGRRSSRERPKKTKSIISDSQFAKKPSHTSNTTVSSSQSPPQENSALSSQTLGSKTEPNPPSLPPKPAPKTRAPSVGSDGNPSPGIGINRNSTKDNLEEFSKQALKSVSAKDKETASGFVQTNNPTDDDVKQSQTTIKKAHKESKISSDVPIKLPLMLSASIQKAYYIFAFASKTGELKSFQKTNIAFHLSMNGSSISQYDCDMEKVVNINITSIDNKKEQCEKSVLLIQKYFNRVEKEITLLRVSVPESLREFDLTLMEKAITINLTINFDLNKDLAILTFSHYYVELAVRIKDRFNILIQVRRALRDLVLKEHPEFFKELSRNQVSRFFLSGTKQGSNQPVVSIYVYKMDITKIVVDAIAISTSHDLDSPKDKSNKETNGVASAVLRIGGDDLKLECTNILSSLGKVSPGDVVATAALGGLSSVYVLHGFLGVSFNKRGTTVNLEKSIEHLFRNCLNNAIKYEIVSLALPLFGSGAANQDIRKCIELLIQVLGNCRDDLINHGLRSIHIVDIKEDIVETIIKELIEATTLNPFFKLGFIHNKTSKGLVTLSAAQNITPQLLRSAQTNRLGVTTQRGAKVPNQGNVIVASKESLPPTLFNEVRVVQTEGFSPFSASHQKPEKSALKSNDDLKIRGSFSLAGRSTNANELKRTGSLRNYIKQPNGRSLSGIDNSQLQLATTQLSSASNIQLTSSGPPSLPPLDPLKTE